MSFVIVIALSIRQWVRASFKMDLGWPLTPEDSTVQYWGLSRLPCLIICQPVVLLISVLTSPNFLFLPHFFLEIWPLHPLVPLMTHFCWNPDLWPAWTQTMAQLHAGKATTRYQVTGECANRFAPTSSATMRRGRRRRREEEAREGGERRRRREADDTRAGTSRRQFLSGCQAPHISSRQEGGATKDSCAVSVFRILLVKISVIFIFFQSIYILFYLLFLETGWSS